MLMVWDWGLQSEQLYPDDGVVHYFTKFGRYFEAK